MNQLSRYCLLFFAIAMHLYCHGADDLQNQKQTDSLIRVSTSEVYENPDKAIRVGQSILDDPNTNTQTKIRGLMLISMAYSSKRDYQKSLEYTIKASQLSNKFDDPIMRIRILTRTGILYQQLKIFDKAIQVLDESENLCLRYPVADSVNVFLANTYVVKGFIYKDKLNCDIAISFFDKGIEVFNKINPHIPHANISIAQYNKGNCYILFSDYEAAKKSFEESIASAKKENANSLQAFAQKGLAEVYTLESRYKESVDLLKDALRISENVGDLILNQGIYKGLSDNYLAMNDWSNYQKYHDLYLNTHLKVKESERKSISNSIKEISDSHKEKLGTIIYNFRRNIATLIFITASVVIFFVFLLKKNKKSIAKLEKTIQIMQKNKTEGLE